MKIMSASRSKHERKRRELLSDQGILSAIRVTYVVADERTWRVCAQNFRDEQVYLYRLNTPPDVIRKVFLDYLEQVNHLKKKPEWYNALTSNCTSNIRGHTKPYAARSPWSWKLIINGYLDEMVYDQRLGRSQSAIP